MKKKQKQEYYYRGFVYQYAFREDTLQRLKRTEQIMDLVVWLYKLPNNAIIALYYCTKWKGMYVTLNEFLEDYEKGLIRFSGMKNQYSLLGMKGLMREAIRKYRIF